MSAEESPEQPKKTHLGVVRDLYPFQLIGGTKNWEVFKAVKLADKTFEKIPAYVGTYPKGSLTQDYGDNDVHSGKGGRSPVTDIDVVPLVDRDQKGWESFTLLGSACDKFATVAQRKLNRPVQMHPVSFSLKVFWGEISDLRERAEQGRVVKKIFFNRYIGIHYAACGILAEMSRVMKGSKVGKYREDMRKALYTLPRNVRFTLIEMAAQYLQKKDSHSRWKRAERLTRARIPILTQRQFVKDWESRRRELWAQHLGFLWLEDNERAEFFLQLKKAERSVPDQEPG